jgi:hypothetical protein
MSKTILALVALSFAAVTQATALPSQPASADALRAATQPDATPTAGIILQRKWRVLPPNPCKMYCRTWR